MKTLVRMLVFLFWIVLLAPPVLGILHEMGHRVAWWQKSQMLMRLVNWHAAIITSAPGIIIGLPVVLFMILFTLIAWETTKPIDHDAYDVGPDLSEHCD